MRFVRKPKPYSSGLLGGLNWPARQPGARRKPHKGRQARPRRPATEPRPNLSGRPPLVWGRRSVSALAVLGLFAVLLIGGFAVYNQLDRQAQFTAVGNAVSELPR